MNTSEHYAMDVPKLTRIVEPEEHAGKLIMYVEYIPTPRREVKYVIDTGEVIWLPAHSKVKVEAGPEREAKLEWARGVASGAHPPVAPEDVVNGIAVEFANEYDGAAVSPPDELGRVKIEAYNDDIVMRIVVVSPDGTVTPSLTPVERDHNRRSDPYSQGEADYAPGDRRDMDPARYGAAGIAGEDE